jgi:enamine deaminase RidA (YjgF/YER057c/UK114 family)
MNAKQKRDLQRLRRVPEFIGARAEFTAAAGAAAATAGTIGSITSAQAAALAEQLGVISGVIEEVTTLAAQQDMQARIGQAATAEAKRLRAELFEHHVRPVASIARMAIPDVVKMTVELRVPAAHLDAEALFAAAERMASVAEKYAERLLVRGLPADFVAQMRSVAADYKKEIDAHGQARGRLTGATTGIRAELEIGRKAVETISVIVVKTLRNDPAALAEWNQIKRVTIKGRKPSIQPVDPPATA